MTEAEEQEYDIGNVKLKVYNQNAQLKVYKCPYIGCNKVFMRKEDRDLHLMLDHGEIIRRIKPKVVFSKPFELKKGIDEMLIIVNRQRLKYFAMLLGELFEPKEKKLKAPTPREVKEKENVAVYVEPKRKGVWIRIKELFRGKNGGNTAATEGKQ